MPEPASLTPEAFIAHWSKAEANERANSQTFLLQLTQMIGVPAPSNTHEHGYSFEFPVKVPGTGSTNFLDLYRRAHFVLESKQFAALREEQTELELAAQKAGVIEGKTKSGPVRGTAAWDDAMIRAKGQAERYVRYLPADEPTPPFIIVCDVGHSFEIYADFTQAGKAYLPFPDPRSFRIKLADLADEEVRDRLRLIWTNPTALDPAKVSADVTRTIAGYLAELAKSLEQSGHDPEVVAHFLTRCLFCMFAEDVGLLPARSFTELLDGLPKDGTGFVSIIGTLFREMNTGTKGDISVVLRHKLLRFNGGLFADGTVLPVNGLQLSLLKQAAKTNWRNVEPAIFGTLLERALVPEERHALGAHFTPRAYVERLVLPTVVTPLREEWESVRTAAIALRKRAEARQLESDALKASSKEKHAQGEIDAAKADYKRATDAERESLAALRQAGEEITRFHDHLCTVTVLDPACGSGNFLYVALEHLKRLEGEVIDFSAQFGLEVNLDLATHTVDPHQFLGIELNPRAAAIAELVLWIGYLQWHFRTRGQTLPDEPILKRFKNIENRDAVLEYDGDPQPARDEAGNIITVWDRRSMKPDIVTNRNVPDESKRVPLLTYANPRPASWPRADYIVGNPPFIGKVKLREDLGDGYAETLRAAYPDVPDSADFVLYWWHKAAELTRTGSARRFGLITTNSLRQTFARRIVQHHLTGAASKAGAKHGGTERSADTPVSSGGGQQRSADTPVRPTKNGGEAAKLNEAGKSARAPLSLLFAIPDHPWVDSAEGAAVRIAMTVGAAGEHTGELLEVADEDDIADDGTAHVSFSPAKQGRISADLTVGADVAGAKPLKANDLLAGTGLILGGRGFVITAGEAESFINRNPASEPLIGPLFNGEDINGTPRGCCVIDPQGWAEEELRTHVPEIYQHLFTTVYPERQQNRDPKLRKNWWLFRRSNDLIRSAIDGLPRFIATVETSKHRMFLFLPAKAKPEHKLVVIGSDDAFHLGILSSRIHGTYALAAGGWLGVGNDPVYSKTRCFDPFPFPLCDEATKERIRSLAEQLDAHRKRVQAQHPGLTLTGMYNVLEKLRADQPLTDKEKLIHDQGLVSVLKQLHDDLDAAVFAAYGWQHLWEAHLEAQAGSLLDFKTNAIAQLACGPDGPGPAITAWERELDAEILQRLVTLNAQRAEDEKRGIIHWLRPDYQRSKEQGARSTEQDELPLKAKKAAKPKAGSKLCAPGSKPAKQSWPKSLADRIRAVEQALHTTGTTTAEALSKSFSRAKPADVQEILESLVALGRARKDGEHFSV